MNESTPLIFDGFDMTPEQEALLEDLKEAFPSNKVSMNPLDLRHWNIKTIKVDVPTSGIGCKSLIFFKAEKEWRAFNIEGALVGTFGLEGSPLEFFKKYLISEAQSLEERKNQVLSSVQALDEIKTQASTQ